MLSLPREHMIHSTSFCDEVKIRRGLNPCLQCKGKAMKKARCNGVPYGGLCINGVYEFCYPVYSKDNLICIIFVGNIINDMDAFLEKSGLPADSPIIDTMERNMDASKCMQVASVVASYILMMIENLPNINAEKHTNATVASVKSYLECYFYLNISLSEIARMYNYNEKYLGTLFKKQVGVSFHDFLNNRRLYRARMLLEESNDSVLSIATRVGFNNVTYFNRLFRERYGVTPTQYRAGTKKQKDK